MDSEMTLRAIQQDREREAGRALRLRATVPAEAICCSPEVATRGERSSFAGRLGGWLSGAFGPSPARHPRA
jgi:hypothetical protein